MERVKRTLVGADVDRPVNAYGHRRIGIAAVGKREVPLECAVAGIKRIDPGIIRAKVERSVRCQRGRGFHITTRIEAPLWIACCCVERHHTATCSHIKRPVGTQGSAGIDARCLNRSGPANGTRGAIEGIELAIVSANIDHAIRADDGRSFNPVGKACRCAPAQGAGRAAS